MKGSVSCHRCGITQKLCATGGECPSGIPVAEHDDDRAAWGHDGGGGHALVAAGRFGREAGEMGQGRRVAESCGEVTSVVMAVLIETIGQWREKARQGTAWEKQRALRLGRASSAVPGEARREGGACGERVRVDRLAREMMRCEVEQADVMGERGKDRWVVDGVSTKPRVQSPETAAEDQTCERADFTRSSLARCPTARER